MSVLAVGTIGLSLLATTDVAALTCVEINGAGEAAFLRSLQALPKTKRRGIPAVYRVAAAGSVPAAELAAADVIVVDPPRKGLEASLTAALLSLDPCTTSGVVAGAQAQRVSTGAQAQHAAAGGGSADTVSPEQRSAVGKQRLVYLSCGLDALLRDLELLLAPQAPGGRAVWQLLQAQAFVFFPGTDSIETLVLLERC